VDPVSTIRVPDDFEHEFPGASRSAAEVAANLVRTATALDAEIARVPRQAADLSTSGFLVLTILDGAAEPMSSHMIAERMLLSSASMTSLLDTLERRNLIQRLPHPTDRRKALIHLTDEAQRLVDEQLPHVHAVITEAVGDLTERERARLLTALTTIRRRLDEQSGQATPTPKGARQRVHRGDSE